jgi:hypothetical protein
MYLAQPSFPLFPGFSGAAPQTGHASGSSFVQSVALEKCFLPEKCAEYIMQIDSHMSMSGIALLDADLGHGIKWKQTEP